MKLPSKSEGVKAVRVKEESVFVFSLIKRFGTLIFEKALCIRLERNLLGILIGSVWIRFCIRGEFFNSTGRTTYALLISETRTGQVFFDSSKI